MKNIEIPYKEERSWRYRFFEILPGALSWFMLLLPLTLSLIDVRIASVFILVYLLIFFARSMGVNIRSFQGYNMMERHKKLPWLDMLQELEQGKVADPSAKRLTWHLDNITRLKAQAPVIRPSEMIHVVMIATYNETREVVEPTIQSLIDSEYNMDQVILVLAYEQRGGPEVAKQSKALVTQYKSTFKHAMAVGHPSDIPREVKGKGANIVYAARELEKYLEGQKIDPLNVIITTLDADNRPHPKYLAALSYVYAVYPDPEHISVQPISVYNNNIWDAPAPMRVIATGNTFYNIVLSQRQHMLRNFSAHAQNMKALVATDYWSVRTIVEDGHQFWRSYFRFDGNYRVLPLYVPIYQDAVLADGYLKTLKAQFIQLRRWTYGASDISYVITRTRQNWRKLPHFDVLSKIGRLVEGHVTWAVGPLISLTAGFIPSLIHRNSYNALELPVIVSHVQTVALIGLSASLFICFKTLPPKPARYRRHRTVLMVLQWVYLPVTTIAYGCFAALNSQTRLIFGKYLDKFDVTEKATVTAGGQRISRDTKE